jgi:acyl carrier protein
VRTKIVDFIVERSGVREADIGPNATLFSSGLLGSMDLVQLVVFIEREFGVRPSDFMRVSPESFDRLDDIAGSIAAQSNAHVS